MGSQLKVTSLVVTIPLVKAQSVKVSMRDHPQSAASSYGRTIPPVINDVYTAARLEKLAFVV